MEKKEFEYSITDIAENTHKIIDDIECSNMKKIVCALDSIQMSLATIAHAVTVTSDPWEDGSIAGYMEDIALVYRRKSE